MFFSQFKFATKEFEVMYEITTLVMNEMGIQRKEATPSVEEVTLKSLEFTSKQGFEVSFAENRAEFSNSTELMLSNDE